MDQLWKCMHWPFCPGVFVAILAFVAAAVTFRKDPSPPEKAIWIVVFFGLMVGEITMMSIERTNSEHDRQLAEQRLADQFSGIANGIRETINKSQAQFVATMDKSNKIFGGINEAVANQIGGDSFCYVNASPFPSSKSVQLVLLQQGMHHMIHINVRVVDLNAMASSSDFFKSTTQSEVPFLARGTVKMLGDYTLSSDDYQKYNVFILAANGYFVESIRLKKAHGTDTWLRAVWVTASYYNGTSGIVMEDTNKFPRDVLEDDADWKSVHDKKRLHIKK